MNLAFFNAAFMAVRTFGLNLVTSIFDVFTAIGEWIVGAFNQMQALFWTVSESGGAGSLTFLGTLMVISVGIGLIFLIIGVIQRFLHLRS